MKDLCIVAMEYLEPEWAATREAIEAVGCDVVYADRQGVGNMSYAYNKAAAGIVGSYRYLWFVSNILFEPWQAGVLLEGMEGWGAVHPAFSSDHRHLWPGDEIGIVEVPYVEWTAPMVDASLFAKIQLDRRMPYWGMDLDWSYRARQLGYRLGCSHDVVIGHEYIRNNPKPHQVTIKRRRMRRQTDQPTHQQLIRKYGRDWRNVLGYTDTKKTIWTN
ncbi:MAG TPA: hypothetical protein PLI89_02720 [Chitinophagales bacterium]|nr:hypothetical protein [Chitinophagales bacterium]HQU38753.1 hypothetical protein [Chitinophagales bacterium]